MSTSIEFPVGFRPLGTALATRKVYQKYSSVFISFNGMQPVSRPPEGDSDLKKLLDNPRCPIMPSKHLPYAPFVLRMLSKGDRHMGRLVFEESGIPFVKQTEGDRETFRFDPVWTEKWHRLESGLCRIADSLKAISPLDPRIFLPAVPSHFQYDMDFNSHDALCKSVLRSRGAIRISMLLGWCISF